LVTWTESPSAAVFLVARAIHERTGEVALDKSQVLRHGAVVVTGPTPNKQKNTVGPQLGGIELDNPTEIPCGLPVIAQFPVDYSPAEDRLDVIRTTLDEGVEIRDIRVLHPDILKAKLEVFLCALMAGIYLQSPLVIPDGLGQAASILVHDAPQVIDIRCGRVEASARSRSATASVGLFIFKKASARLT